MTLFEYLAIAFSLVLSFSSIRLVGGLPHAIQRDRRYWIHLAFVVVLLSTVANTFWVSWSYRDVPWNYPKFLLALAEPAFVYFLAATIVPENPSTVGSWRGYYYSVRRRYFVVVACWVVLISTNSSVLLELPLSHPVRFWHLGIFAVSVCGAISPNPRVHMGLALVSLFASAAAIFSLFIQPAALAK